METADRPSSGGSARAASSAQPGGQYKVIAAFTGLDLEEQLNLAHADGYELVDLDAGSRRIVAVLRSEGRSAYRPARGFHSGEAQPAERGDTRDIRTK